MRSCYCELRIWHTRRCTRQYSPTFRNKLACYTVQYTGITHRWSFNIYQLNYCQDATSPLPPFDTKQNRHINQLNSIPTSFLSLIFTDVKHNINRILCPMISLFLLCSFTMCLCKHQQIQIYYRTISDWKSNFNRFLNFLMG